MRRAILGLPPHGFDLIQGQMDRQLIVDGAERSNVPEQIHAIEAHLQGFKVARLTVAITRPGRERRPDDPPKRKHEAFDGWNRAEKGSS